MLSDYVSTPKGIFRVTAIQDNDVIFTDYADDITGAVDIEDVQPVPLTEETLEANGFETHDWADSKLFVHGFENDDLICPFFVEYRIDNQCLFVNEGLVPTPVYYVHQLQHALRLCGLNNEADNFKLEGDIK
ncbi:MAG: hypothetical protein K6G25_06375 [Bacteroidales bacterium]|nr:hypothetical protein [Bacteroidales bacterium]